MASNMDDTTKMLMDINEKVGKINQKLDDMGGVDEKADKAISMAKENEHRIDRLTSIQNWLIGTLVGGGLVVLLIYVAEKFL